MRGRIIANLIDNHKHEEDRLREVWELKQELKYLRDNHEHEEDRLREAWELRQEEKDRERMEQQRLQLGSEALGETERGQDQAIDVAALEAKIERMERTTASANDDHEQLGKDLDALFRNLEQIRHDSAEKAEDGMSEDESRRMEAALLGGERKGRDEANAEELTAMRRRGPYV